MRNGDHSWEADFPMREEVEDHGGRTRSFVINATRGAWAGRCAPRRKVVGALATSSRPIARQAPTAPSAD